MPDAAGQQIHALSAHLEGLEAVVAHLADDAGARVTARRIARALQVAALTMEATEIAAGARAIQRATDPQLARSVRNFLDRVEELRAEAPHARSSILVVEDNKTVAAATTAYLGGPGRTVTVVETAADAEAHLERNEVDLVVLDLILPDRDGRDLLVQMKERPETATLPVIVLSARGGSATRSECLAVGASEFLEKPVEPHELRGAASRQLRHARAERDQIRDGLTGLLNRAGLATALADAGRAGGKHGPLPVAVLRIGALGAVRAAHGAEAADRFLLEVAHVAHAALAPGDLLCRWERATLVAVHRKGEAAEAEGTWRRLLEDLLAMEELDGLAGDAPPVEVGLSTLGSGGDLREAISLAGRSPLLRPPSSGALEEPGVAPPPEAKLHPRVLLVEDDHVTGMLVRHRLIRDGYEVIDFTNGEDAFAWSVDGDFDLAILDVKMPGMDGFELLDRLRASPRHAGSPIVMLTGMGSEADVIRGLELGANDYMLKPFSPAELLARVRRLMHGSDSRTEAPPRNTNRL